MTDARRRPSGAAVLRPALTDAITNAAIEELVEQGYARLSMERVARRAAVGKGALYRRWPSKVDMVVDVLGQLSVPAGAPPDTGTLRGDIRCMLQSIVEWFTDPRIRAVLPDLIAEFDRNPTLARATATHIGDPRRGWGRDVLQRAERRGQLTSEQTDLLLDLLAAPAYWRITHGRPVDALYLDQLTDLLVNGLAGDSGGAGFGGVGH